MVNKDNLGIADQEFIDAGELLNKYGNELQKDMGEYCECLETVCKTAIKDTKIRNKLVKICEKIEKLREKVSDISAKAEKECKTYIKEVDKIDTFLY